MKKKDEIKQEESEISFLGGHKMSIRKGNNIYNANVTVGELIEKLKKFNKDKYIVIKGDSLLYPSIYCLVEASATKDADIYQRGLLNNVVYLRVTNVPFNYFNDKSI